MTPRYLLLVATGGNEVDGIAGAAAARTGLRRGYASGPIAALVNDSCRCIATGASGAVVGTLFPRHGPARPLDALRSAEADAILGSQGDKLVSDYWGGYAAAVAGPRLVRILRDPSGALPCYSAHRSGLSAFASDVDLLIASGLAGPLEIDWRSLARQLLNAGVPVPETALRGVTELLPGFAIGDPVDAGRQLPCWSPWDFAEGYGKGREARAERLARAVVQSVGGWGDSHERLILSVSGGLDSSIVAACLAEAGCDTVCLTMFGEDAGGDERVYARALCRHLDLRLIERPDTLDAVDIERPLAPHLPRPFGRTQALSYEQAHLEVAREIGADAFVTGNGGDSVFGYSQSAAAIADRFLVEGVSAGVMTTLLDVCRQTGCSALEAAAGAYRLARGPRRYRCLPDRLFLHPDAGSTLGSGDPSHPWLDAPPGALPGKAAHIASILRVQHCLEPGRNATLPVLNPLMSQPVLEASLTIPSWEWRAGGVDRAVARQAFSGRLPELIVKRRVKGGPDGFAAKILARYRDRIRERLTGGHLAREGIVDTPAIAAALSDNRPSLGEERVRLLQLLAIEAWLDTWTGSTARARGGARADPAAVSSDGPRRVGDEGRPNAAPPPADPDPWRSLR